jgi:hypothetical protein
MTFNSDKTEIILFSNTDIPEFKNTFNKRTIPITTSHKHLGVTFSSDAKRSMHIQNMMSSIFTNTCNVLRKLKYKLSEKSRETIFSLYQTNF